MPGPKQFLLLHDGIRISAGGSNACRTASTSSATLLALVRMTGEVFAAKGAKGAKEPTTEQQKIFIAEKAEGAEGTFPGGRNSVTSYANREENQGIWGDRPKPCPTTLKATSSDILTQPLGASPRGSVQGARGAEPVRLDSVLIGGYVCFLIGGVSQIMNPNEFPITWVTSLTA